MPVLKLLKSLFFDKKSPEDQAGPDLFEYAAGYARTDPGSDAAKNPHNKKRILFLVFVLSAAFAAGLILACLFCGSDSFNKKAKIIRKDGTWLTGTIKYFDKNNLYYIPDSGEGSSIAISLNEVRLIEFHSEPEAVKEENNKQNINNLQQNRETAKVRELTPDERRFLGKWTADISGHKADLVFFAAKNGYLGASLRFHSWGSGEIHYMKDVRVNGKTVFFKRQCEPDLCRRLGSQHTINQDFSGEISDNNSEIKGSYLGGQNASRWSAKR